MTNLDTLARQGFMVLLSLGVPFAAAVFFAGFLGSIFLGVFSIRDPGLSFGIKLSALIGLGTALSLTFFQPLLDLAIAAWGGGVP